METKQQRPWERAESFEQFVLGLGGLELELPYWTRPRSKFVAAHWRDRGSTLHLRGPDRGMRKG